MKRCRWLAAGLWLAVSAAGGQEPVDLVDDPTGSLPLAHRVAELQDPEGRWTLDDVRRPELAAQFRTLARGAVSQGMSGDAWWYRLSLRAPPETGIRTWLLAVGHPTLDHVDIHVTRADGRTETTLAGDLRAAPPNLVPSSPFAIPVQVEAGEQVMVHVRVQTTGRHQVFLDVQSPRGFAAAEQYWNRRNGAVAGILAAMTVFNLLIFLAIRDRAYGYYVMFIAAMLLATLVYSGDLRRWAGTDIALLQWVNVLAPVSAAVAILFNTLFARTFMQTRVHAPNAHRLTHAMVALAVAPLVVLPPGALALALKVLVAALVFNVVGMLAIAAYLAWNGVRAARFYVVAWTPIAVAYLAWTLSILGVLQPYIDLVAAPPLAVCIGVTLLSLALADRLNVERRGRERYERLKQYLPRPVADLVVASGSTNVLEPRRRNVTVMVIDLRGFTPFSETSAPEDVMGVLREFFEAMGAIVEKHGGAVEHFAGDSMLIFFNAPLEIPKPEEQAVRAALEMRVAFEGLRATWARHGHELGLGIGIADGYATVGAIGFAGRSQYAAIGAVTNLAARLCSDAKHGEILTTGRVLAAVENGFDTEPAGERAIRGFSRPVQVARVLGARAPAMGAPAPAPA